MCGWYRQRGYACGGVTLNLALATAQATGGSGQDASTRSMAALVTM
jgi:hypothetical protein